MLMPDQPLAIHMEDNLGGPHGKMGDGILRFSPNPIVSVVDSAHAGQPLSRVIDTHRDCPVVATVDDCRDLGAQVLVLGIAIPGGKIPDAWYADLDRAAELGMSLVNGLHDPLETRYSGLAPGQWVWDIRKEPDGLGVAGRRAADLHNRRVVVVGTDMAQGKMTAALLLNAAAGARGLNSSFLATGQIGIAISGSGVPLDAVKLDYASGAIERAMLERRDADIVFVEGQGSILHPASSATLPLLRGACPTHLVLCHKPTARGFKNHPDLPVPPLPDVIRLYEDVSSACGVFPRPVTAGIVLNTAGLSDADARAAAAAIEQDTGLVACDALRWGPEPLLNAILT